MLLTISFFSFRRASIHIEITLGLAPEYLNVFPGKIVELFLFALVFCGMVISSADKSVPDAGVTTASIPSFPRPCIGSLNVVLLTVTFEELGNFPL